MNGEKNLKKLLESMRPSLMEGEFVFCTLPDSEVKQVDANCICRFKEEEGTTLILSKTDALKLELPFAYPCRMITLTVHSSLEAVGFLAAIAAKLAEAGISINVISAYYHDHLFVPAEQAEQVMAILTSFGS